MVPGPNQLDPVFDADPCLLYEDENVIRPEFTRSHRFDLLVAHCRSLGGQCFQSQPCHRKIRYPYRCGQR